MSAERFHTDFATRDPGGWERHGLTWTDTDYRELSRLVTENANLSQMCKALARPPDGVLAKLSQRGYIRRDSSDPNPRAYWKLGQTWGMANRSDALDQTNKEEDMTTNAAPIIETVTRILGRDASTMTDDQIFQLIARQEGEIAMLSGIKAKSKKLEARIAEIQSGIEKLVEYVDSRP